MLRNTVLLFLFNLILHQYQARAAPSFITPCKAEDSSCMLASVKLAQMEFAKGMDTPKISPSDPLDIKDVKSYGNNLKIDFKDMKTIGLSKCNVLEAKRDVRAETMSFVLECPIQLVGKYTANGKVLFLEIVGDGDVDIDIEKVKLSVVVKVKTIDGDDGQKHWKFTDFDYTYDFEERAHIKLTNLFGGDETKAKPILDTINAGWKELIPEIGEPLIKQTFSKLFVNINKLFLATPISELQLD